MFCSLQKSLRPKWPSWLACSVAVTVVVTSSLAQTATSLDDQILRAHARLPKYFRSGPPLAQVLSEARVDATSKGMPWKGLDFIVHDSENIRAFTPTGAVNRYQSLTCAADAVVVGHIGSKAHHLSEFGAVYTDYIFNIDTVLKDNRQLSLLSKTAVVVTRPGGALTVNNDAVSFEYDGFPALVGGGAYVQFLQFIPGTLSYQALDSFSTLMASGRDWVLPRKASAVAVVGLTRGVLEAAVGKWQGSCAK
jgi:hypothetical protein